MQAIFSLIGFVFGFNTWKEVVASVRRIITFGAMVVVNTALVVMLFAYGAAILSLLLFVYNKTNQFISYLSNLTSGGSNEILAWAMDIFRALGVWNAFVDVYNVFPFLLFPLLLFMVCVWVLKFSTPYKTRLWRILSQSFNP